MTAKVPAFQDIGKSARELLYGTKDGVFQFNKTATITSRTADGVEFTVTTTQKDDRLDNALKATYKTKNYGIVGSFTSAGKITASASLYDLAPGLTAVLSGTIPEQSSGSLSLDYAIPHLTLKSVVGLTNTPKIDVSASTGRASGLNNTVIGGEVAYDTEKSAITKWSVGAGYNAPDYQAGISLVDMGETLKLSYAHNIDARSTAGAEVQRKLNKDLTSFTLGYARRLDNGAITKYRLDNTGIASALYETNLESKTKVALSAAFNALNLQQAPKVGVALNMTN
jgi:voltage-dependent anion channel protein 2